MQTTFVPRQVTIESFEEFSTVSHAVEAQLGPEHEFTEQIRRDTFNCRDYRNGEFFPGTFEGDEARIIQDSLKKLAKANGGIRHDVADPEDCYGRSAESILRNRTIKMFGQIGETTVKHVVPPLSDPICKAS